MAKLVKLEVIDAPEIYQRKGVTHRLLGTLSDGKRTYWGDARTERGAKSMLTRYAKRSGLKVDGLIAELQTRE